MTLPGLYLDEDIQSVALVTALRARGMHALTTSEAGMSNSTDEEQLEFATSRDLVIVTSNIADFARLHYDRIQAERVHAGIIVVRQQRWGPGDLARRIIRLVTTAPQHDLRNRLEFVGNR